MKKNLFLIGLAIAIVLLGASCGQKEEELTKMIPASAVTISGEHEDIVSIDADSVKVMLVKADDGYEETLWAIRAVIPFKNTVEWENIEDIYQPDENYEFEGYDEYKSNVKFLDKNDSEIDFEVRIDDDAMKDLIKSNKIKTVNIQVKETWSLGCLGYKNAKELFDKVCSISITGIQLKQSRISSYSSSSRSKSSDDDDDDDYGYSSSRSHSSSSDVDWDDVEKATKIANEAIKTSQDAMQTLKDLGY